MQEMWCKYLKVVLIQEKLLLVILPLFHICTFLHIHAAEIKTYGNHHLALSAAIGFLQ